MIYIIQDADGGVGIEGLVSPEDQFFAYYQPNSARSFSKAMADLRGYIATEGPFDGIIAFSQSSSLAAALLLEQEYMAVNMPRGKPRCAIFISGRLPFIDAGRDELPELASKIEVPTVHIWGANDDLEPGNAEELSKLCNSRCSSIVIHNGGHEVPGPSDHRALIASTHAIRRAAVVSDPVSEVAQPGPKLWTQVDRDGRDSRSDLLED